MKYRELKVRIPQTSYFIGMDERVQAAGTIGICLANKVEIHYAKIGPVDCKWSNLNASGTWILVSFTFGVNCMQERGKC